MSFFYWLADKTCYTFAVSFFTVLTALPVAFFTLFLSSSFIVDMGPDLMKNLSYAFAAGMPVVIMLHYIHFGLLTPLKIPAFMKSHRRINKAFKNSFNENPEQLERVYKDLSDLPMYNMLTAVFYTACLGLLITGYGFFHYGYTEFFSFRDLQLVFRMMILGIAVAMIIYGLFSYLLAEALSNNERSMLYNRMLESGIKRRPRILIGIRLKFFFFVMVMVITLISFAAFMEEGRYYGELYTFQIVIYFTLSVVAGLVLMQITTNSIVKILRDINRVSREIASGGKAVFSVLSLEREFVGIEYSMMEMSWEIEGHRQNLEEKVEQRTFELQEALTDLKGRDDLIQKQLDMASIIQRSILPGRIDDWNELKFSVKYIAMEKIGGDFYDIIQLKDDRLGVLVADVSGHGIPAALVTTMAKISFGNAGSKFDSPRRIFQEVNQNILDHIKTQDYMTCFMAVVDDEYNLVYSNASHQKGILLHTASGEIEYLDTDGLFLGAIEEARDTYGEARSRLDYGDRLILYTDGITESMSPERKEYGLKNFEKSIIQKKEMPLNEFSDAIIDDVRNHIGSAQIIDDITLIVVELARDEAVDVVKRSKKLTAAHQYGEAVDLLEKGLEKYPDNRKILYNLSKNHFRMNNYDMAVEVIDKYIEGDQKNKYAYYIAGASCYQLGRFDEAVEYFEKAIYLDSAFVYAIFALGMAYKQNGQHDEAVKAFERVANIDPDNKMALYQLQLLNEETQS